MTDHDDLYRALGWLTLLSLMDSLLCGHESHGLGI